MSVACRIAMGTVRRLGSLAVALLGLVLLAGVIVPSGPEAAVGLELDGTATPPRTVVLNVPEGYPAGSVTVVDPKGRLLATLTLWKDGQTILTSSPAVGPRLACERMPGGEVAVLVAGAGREADIFVRSDGSLQSPVVERPSARPPKDEESP